MIRACIFDLDGTLLDTAENIAYNMNRTLREFGFPALPVDKIRSFVGNGARLLTERTLTAVGHEDAYPVFFPRFMQNYGEEPMHLACPYRGIPEMLSSLSTCDVRLAIATNKPAHAAQPMADMLFPGVFSAVIGASDELPLKPAPDGVFQILHTFGVEPCEALYMGDSGVDMETAKNAGLFAVGCLWGFRPREELIASGADAVIAHPEEFLKIWETQNGTSQN
jgi:phosphoglycolate phosphatase